MPRQNFAWRFSRCPARGPARWPAPRRPAPPRPAPLLRPPPRHARSTCCPAAALQQDHLDIRVVPSFQEVEKEDRNGEKHTMTAVKLQVGAGGAWGQLEWVGCTV